MIGRVRGALHWGSLLATGLLLGACGESEGSGGSAGNGGDIVIPEAPVEGVSSGCGSVRLTAYEAGESGWCEFSDTHAILPDFVRARMTLAIAEPYNGGSYGGKPGEACGECWELDTLGGTETVMVNNLCPIEGNPLCAGGHFHFDLSQEAGTALDAGGLDEGTVRRVPCPVTGSIHAQINDRNEWGYLRLAFVNHRFPIRTAEYRASDGDTWKAVERSGGAWHISEDAATFADGGPGGVFRFTSPTGEVTEGSAILTTPTESDTLFDTGAQFAETEPEGGACTFIPPGAVYVDGWGGIDQVRWQCNPWGDARCSESSSGCADGSSSCVLVENLEQWAGLHIYYRQDFPAATFSSLTLKLRSEGSGGTVVVAASEEGVRCEETSVEVTEAWTTVTLDLAATCTELETLNAVTMSNQSDTMTLLLDDIVFAE